MTETGSTESKSTLSGLNSSEDIVSLLASEHVVWEEYLLLMPGTRLSYTAALVGRVDVRQGEPRHHLKRVILVLTKDGIRCK